MTALRRRRNGAAARRPLTDLGASPQPGASVGVGGRGRRAACATHHRTKRTSDRGEDATTASCGAIMNSLNETWGGPSELGFQVIFHKVTVRKKKKKKMEIDFR